jgi:hypothetical protein
MKRLAIPILVVVILAAAGFWWFSPTQALKRKTHSLLETLTFDSGSGHVSRQAGAYALNTLLAPQVTLDTPTIKEANGTFERAELESAYSWLANQAKQTRFELLDFQSIDLKGQKATLKLSLEAVVELPNYRPADGTYDVTFDWEKSEDGWRLHRAVWTQRL